MEQPTKNKITITRGPKSKDVMPFMSVISKFGINNFKTVFSKEFVGALVNSKGIISIDVERIQQAIGMAMFMEIIQIFTERLPECEVELFTFITRFVDLTLEEVMDLPIDELLELVYQFINHESFKGFIKVASKFR